MKVKDLLENYQGDNYIEIYDCFSWQTKGFNNKEVAIRKYGHYTVQSWTVLTVNDFMSCHQTAHTNCHQIA